MDKCEFCSAKKEGYTLNVIEKKSGFFSSQPKPREIKVCTACVPYLWKKTEYFGLEEIPIDLYERIMSDFAPELNKLTPCKCCESENNMVCKSNCVICGMDYCDDCPSFNTEEYGFCPHCIFKAFYNPITKLLKEKSKQMSISDIAAFISQDREEVKICLDLMYKLKMIDFGGDGRYFILSDKKKAAKATSKKSDTTDVKAELKKYKQMLDEGLITQDQYDAKSNGLLGL